jgi:hypothetical protein
MNKLTFRLVLLSVCICLTTFVIAQPPKFKAPVVTINDARLSPPREIPHNNPLPFELKKRSRPFKLIGAENVTASSTSIFSIADNEFKRKDFETDDLPRLKRLLEKAHSNNGTYGGGGCTVYLPSGDYILSDTLEAHDLGCTRIIGEGTGTRIIYNGPAEKPILSITQCYRCEFRGFILATYIKNTKCGIQISNAASGTPGTWVSSACRFDDVHIGAFGTGDMAYGINIDNITNGGPDWNNEHHRFTRVICGNYYVAGCRLYGSNVHATVFDGCELVGSSHDPAAPYGILAEYASFFYWRHGFMYGHSGYDFYLGAFQVLVSIIEFNGEKSEGFVFGGGMTGAPMPIKIENCRWDGLPKEGKPVVLILQPGPVTMRDNRITGILNAVWPQFQMGTFWPGSYTFENNFIASNNDDFPPNIRLKGAWGKVRDSGNIWQRKDGQYQLTPEP